MHLPPSSSITSTYLISTSTQLHAPPPSSFQPPPSSLQHPQQYPNQNIARNWAISPNLGQKIQRCPFWLKIGSQGMLEVPILNPDLDFWTSDPKIHFLANLDSKIKSCPFYLKIGTHGISGMLILIPRLIFWDSNPIIDFWTNLGQKYPKLCVLPENCHTWYLEYANFHSNISFLNFQLYIPFWENLGKKNQSSPFCLNIGTHGIFSKLILIPALVF